VLAGVFGGSRLKRLGEFGSPANSAMRRRGVGRRARGPEEVPCALRASQCRRQRCGGVSLSGGKPGSDRQHSVMRGKRSPRQPH
jgi:hypothetical protein